jgi:hypothetical protein
MKPLRHLVSTKGWIALRINTRGCLLTSTSTCVHTPPLITHRHTHSHTPHMLHSCASYWSHYSLADPSPHSSVLYTSLRQGQNTPKYLCTNAQTYMCRPKYFTLTPSARPFQLSRANMLHVMEKQMTSSTHMHAYLFRCLKIPSGISSQQEFPEVGSCSQRN